ncbi:hypothetical protein IHQ71_02245 [Rhizobium sp. TH2]|uniref:aldose epimerase family protein n=1 Tax=Rhizobium sp. TH2 TaxID=2775403 RepID=UPI00220C192F|nr:hypothetical protein IHQ71_02245 [Rhizobium sp. TH2]
MSVVVLQQGATQARVSTNGGSVLSLEVGRVPLLRPAFDDAAVTDSAGFPMVPFGNRVRGNTFVFEGQDIHLASQPGMGSPLPSWRRLARGLDRGRSAGRPPVDSSHA